MTGKVRDIPVDIEIHARLSIGFKAPGVREAISRACRDLLESHSRRGHPVHVAPLQEAVQRVEGVELVERFRMARRGTPPDEAASATIMISADERPVPGEMVIELQASRLAP